MRNIGAELSAIFNKQKPDISKVFPKLKKAPRRPVQTESTQHGGGPITAQSRFESEFNKREGEGKYTVEQINNHKIRQSVVQAWGPENRGPMNTIGQPLTAAERQATFHQFNYMVNPMQDLDYLVIEAIVGNTIAGPFMDTLTKFIMGTAVRPELYVLDPDKKDPQKDVKAIADNQDIIKILRDIDQRVNKSTKTVGIFDKWGATIGNTNIYNRAGLLFGYSGDPFEVDGKKYPDVPRSLNPMHPRDMGLIEVNPDTWDIEGVQWGWVNEIVEAKDMIYCWNPMTTAKRHRAWNYGTSLVLPFLDAARTLRRIMAIDFPAMAQSAWSGHSFVVVKPTGQPGTAKENEYQQVASRITPGTTNILLENPDDVAVHNVQYDPKISEFVLMYESLLKYMISSLQLPYSLFFDEGASNQNTAHEKVALALQAAISPFRSQIDRVITPQWYGRWFDKFATPEQKETFGVRMIFDNIDVAQWYDKVDSLVSLNGMVPLKHSALGELLNIPNFTDMVDTEMSDVQVPIQPGGGNGGGFSRYGIKGERDVSIQKR